MRESINTLIKETLLDKSDTSKDKTLNRGQIISKAWYWEMSKTAGNGQIGYIVQNDVESRANSGSAGSKCPTHLLQVLAVLNE